MHDEVPSPESLAQRASRAFGWSFSNTVVSRLGTLAIGVVLARVLGAEQFGIFAVATVTLLAVLSFNEVGVSLAIVRWRDAPTRIAPTVNTIAVASSALLTALMLLGAPWISAALGDVRATSVVQVMALSVLINGLVATPAAILQREFMQKQRTIADQVNTWLGVTLSVVLALSGWGAMSLAIGRVVASVVFGVMLWRWSPVPYRFGWDKEVARRLLRFGLPLALSSIVVFASGYADQIIIGSALGVQALGFYVLAFNLASWPLSIFSQPLRAVAPAAFSAMKHDPRRLSRNFVRLLTLLTSVAIPTCLALSGASGPIIEFVYGSDWSASADVLLWLGVLAALRICFELAYDYVVVVGKSQWVLVIQTASFAVGLPAMYLIVTPFGEAGVAAVQLCVGLVLTAPMYVVYVARCHIRVAAILKAVWLPAAVGLGVWLSCWALAHLVDSAFLAAVAAGVVAALAIMALSYRQRDQLQLLRSRVTAKGMA